MTYFRRTFAGNLWNAKIDGVTIQKLMGHTSQNQTAKYDRRLEVARRQAVKGCRCPISATRRIMFIAQEDYSKLIDLSLEENVDNYIQAGWDLIEARTILIGDDAAILAYRLGWPRNAGNPIEPPVIEEIQAYRYLGPSIN